MLPLPSRRLLLLLVAAAPLFLFGIWIGLAADLLILVAAAADAVLIPRPGQLHLERRVPGRVSLGGEAEIELEVESTFPRPLRLRVTDDLPPSLGRRGGEVLELVLPPRGRARAAYRVDAIERGEATLGDLHLRLLGPLGLVWRQRRERRTDTILVQPGLAEVGRARLLGMRHRLREPGMRAVRAGGEGTSFESLREYVRGDDPRRIDWKATARRGNLIVRQFEAERSQDVLVAIDAGRWMAERIGGRERLDHALAAALLLADTAAAQGDRVGVFVFAERVEHFLPPARASLPRLADVLGRVEARLREPDYPAAFAYLSRQLRRRSLLVLFTDVIDARTSAALLAHLGAAAHRHLVLAVTLRNTALDAAATTPMHDEAAVFRRAAAEELLGARSQALVTMQRAGVLVADVDPQNATPAVVNRYLEVKRRGLL